MDAMMDACFVSMESIRLLRKTSAFVPGKIAQALVADCFAHPERVIDHVSISRSSCRPADSGRSQRLAREWDAEHSR